MRAPVLGLLVVAACGSSGGGGGGAIPIDDLAPTEIGELCDLEVRCGVFADSQTCLDLFNADFSSTVPDLVAAVKGGKVIYDGNKARTCLDTLIGTSCDRRDVFGNRDAPIECDETFVGTAGDGAMCAINQECVSQQCVLPTCAANTCCVGACMGATAPVRGHIGQACTTQAKCLEGFCDTTTMLCTAFVADGGACSSSASCDSDVCMTTCQALVPTGGACTTSQLCENLGDNCLSATMKCGKGGDVGATCTTSGDCSTLLFCDPTSKLCTALPKLGESCANIGSCADVSFCDTTTMICTARKADGAACTSQNECTSNKCDTSGSMTCFTPPICI
jgi:hypothetical protein